VRTFFPELCVAATLEDQVPDTGTPDPPVFLVHPPDIQSDARQAPNHRNEWERRSGSTSLAR
jgi:hypothetical protein